MAASAARTPSTSRASRGSLMVSSRFSLLHNHSMGRARAGGTILPLRHSMVMDAMTDIKSLSALHDAEATCTRCPLYRHATQLISGEGPKRAKVMLVGEQPGDQEDKQGHPFVGPAGRILDRAIVDAGIERRQVFVTNAVKHFKFEPRGKRRLHKKPNTSEIDACQWWLNLERAIVRPRVVVAMGATAVRGVLGRSVSISSVRGEVLRGDGDAQVIVTIHPSFVLRQQD